MQNSKQNFSWKYGNQDMFKLGNACHSLVRKSSYLSVRKFGVANYASQEIRKCKQYFSEEIWKRKSCFS